MRYVSLDGKKGLAALLCTPQLDGHVRAVMLSASYEGILLRNPKESVKSRALWS